MSLAWRREVSGNAEPLALSSIQESAAVYPKWEGRSLGAVVMAVSLFVGYQLVFRYHTVMVDAWTRALAGLYVVLHGFHLAAIGFVWNPLPSLMSIPFAAARDLWPALMQEGFSSNIESAVFAAVGVYYLNKILWRFGFERTPRVLWSLLYAFNPLILLYSGQTAGISRFRSRSTPSTTATGMNGQNKTENPSDAVIATSGWYHAATMSGVL